MVASEVLTEVGQRVRRALAAGRWRYSRLNDALVAYGLALVGVAGVTLAIAQLGDLHLANTAMLYLIVVLVAAVAFGRGPAIFSAVLAFLSLNFFFTEPRFTLFVTLLDDWIALALFLLTAVVTGTLAAAQRRRAREAEEHERQARVLYDVAAALADPDLGEALKIVAQRLRDEVGASALRITLETSLGGRLASATSAQDPAARSAIEEREPRRAIAVLAPAPSGASEAVRWIRVASPHPARRSSGAALFRLARAPIHSPAGDAGEILLAVHSMAVLDRRAARLLDAVASQLWVALDRARLRREATDAEVLRRADEAKSGLLDAVSHDLRTPLASIIASAESLQQRGVQWSEDERDAFAAAIEQEALRLDRIVGNLLDLGRLRAGAIHADKAWYEPVALIREVVRRLGPLVDRYGQALWLDLPEELPPVAMDYSKVDQILTNLVENAAKHAPTDSQIRVAAAIEDDSLQVVVEDNGPGLDATALERIFEPFYRLGRPAQRGSGLGLAVARGLVEAHRGRIWAEPRPAGGTRFVFTIPGADEE